MYVVERFDRTRNEWEPTGMFLREQEARQDAQRIRTLERCDARTKRAGAGTLNRPVWIRGRRK